MKDLKFFQRPDVDKLEQTESEFRQAAINFIAERIQNAELKNVTFDYFLGEMEENFNVEYFTQKEDDEHNGMINPRFFNNELLQKLKKQSSFAAVEYFFGPKIISGLFQIFNDAGVITNLL